MPERFFKQLLNRLSIPNSRLYATTNPDTPYHYLYREYITDKEKLDSRLVSVIHFDLDDNPALDEGYKNNIRRSYSGVFFQRYILGKWVVAEGAIYADSWSDDLLYSDDTRPVGLLTGYVDRYIGIDYGTTNPMPFLDILDDGETLWIDREYYWDSKKEGRQKTDSEYADDLLEFIGPKEDADIILDPSAASFAAELRTRGIIVRDADNEVMDGIRLVSSMLKRRLIRVHERCVNTQGEIGAYCWDEKAALRGEEKPLKTNDHCADALRYIVKTKIPAWRLAV
jgi:PBSX family phage terminase large subunit